MNDLILNFTPTGMIPTKNHTPHVPISPAEIIEQVHSANELGITMVHLHARNKKNGKPTYKSIIYEEIFLGIRKYCPKLIICASLSGRDFNVFEKRSEVLDLKPDMGSLTLSSLNFPKQASINSPEMIFLLAEKMQKLGVKPEFEVFDLGMINFSKYLIKKGIVTGPYYYNILLGNIAGIQSDFLHIGTAINDLPKNSYWSLGGIGNFQLEANAYSVFAGGGVRVGIEDNIFFDKKNTIKAQNIDLLKRIHNLAEIAEREIMLPETFGKLGFYNENRD